MVGVARAAVYALVIGMLVDVVPIVALSPAPSAPTLSHTTIAATDISTATTAIIVDVVAVVAVQEQAGIMPVETRCKCKHPAP